MVFILSASFFTDHWALSWPLEVRDEQDLIFAFRSLGGFPGGLDGKESVCNAGDPGLIPGSGRFPWRKEWWLLLLNCIRAVMSDSVQPHRWQPTRLPDPWASPGEDTGVGCYCLLQCMKVKSEVAQSRPTLSDPTDSSLPGPPSMGFSRKEYWSGSPVWLPAPTFLPGEFHGQRSLMGYSPWGHKELGMMERVSLWRFGDLEGWGARAYSGEAPLPQTIGVYLQRVDVDMSYLL